MSAEAPVKVALLRLYLLHGGAGNQNLYRIRERAEQSARALSEKTGSRSRIPVSQSVIVIFGGTARRPACLYARTGGDRGQNSPFQDVIPLSA